MPYSKSCQKYKPVRKFAPQWIISAILDKPIEVYGDGSQLMDLVYVGDTAEILIRSLKLAADGQAADQVIDAGPGEGVPVKKIAEILSYILNAKIIYKPMRPGETNKAIIKADTTTLERWLGSFQFTPIEIGMENTVRWYRDHYKELI